MTFNNLIANGKISMLGQFGTYRNRGLASGSDSEVSPERRDKILSRTVTEILMYRDSVAAVVTIFPGSRDSTMRIIGWVTLENGEWRNAGEDLGTGDEGTRNRIISKAPLFLEFVHRIEQLQQIPSNTQPLTDYLSQNGMPPKEYLLDKLSNRKVVVIGELHPSQKFMGYDARADSRSAFCQANRIRFYGATIIQAERHGPFF